MLCQHCHQELPNTAKFCAYCGTPVGSDKPLPATANSDPATLNPATKEDIPWLAIIGFILSVFTGAIGFVVSIFAYTEIRKNHQKRGRRWAIAGMIVGSIGLAINVIALLSRYATVQTH